MSTPIFDALTLQALDFTPHLDCDVTDPEGDCQDVASWRLTVHVAECGHEAVLLSCETHAVLLTSPHVSARGVCEGCGTVGPLVVAHAGRLA
jgi:hypothetical protein